MPELIQKKPKDGGVFRVHFLKERQGYYNLNYSDPQIWESFRLDILGTRSLVHGYARRGTPLSFQLRAHAQTRLWTPAIVKLQFSEGSIGDETHVEILEIMNTSWLADYK